jgi:hypothetical protein
MRPMLEWCGICLQDQTKVVAEKVVSGVPLCRPCLETYSSEPRILKEAKNFLANIEDKPDTATFNETTEDEIVEAGPSPIATTKTQSKRPGPIHSVAMKLNDTTTAEVSGLTARQVQELRESVVPEIPPDLTTSEPLELDKQGREAELTQKVQELERYIETLLELRYEITDEGLERFRDAALLDLAMETLRKYSDRLEKRVEKLKLDDKR